MKKLSYAIIASTGLIVAGFSQDHATCIFAMGFASVFATFAVLTNEANK